MNTIKLTKDNYIPREVIMQTKEETAFLVAQAIQDERVYKNITQRQLAKKCETNISKIRRFEQTGNIDLPTFLQILKKLDVYDPIESVIDNSSRYLEKSVVAYKDRIDFDGKRARTRNETNEQQPNNII